MLVRWSIWGKPASADLEMLVDSVQSFRSVLGTRARYLVHTDRVAPVRRALPETDVLPYPRFPTDSPILLAGSTWNKWCPDPRLAPGELELLVDTDVFLLDEPTEVLELASPSSQYDYAILAEALGAPWQRGCFANCVPADVPFVNAGLVAQGPRGNLAPALNAAFSWWKINIQEEHITFHDEQGAVTLALVDAMERRSALLLPTSRYAIVSPRSNADTASVDGLALLHATHPGHPAYLRFRHAIRRRRCQ